MSGEPAACASPTSRGRSRVEGPPVGHAGQRVGQRVELQLPGPPQQRLLLDPQPGRGRPAHPDLVLGAPVPLVHLPVPPQRVRRPALRLGDPGEQEGAVLGEGRRPQPRRLLPVRGQQVPGVRVPPLGGQHRALGVQPAAAQQRGDRPGRGVPGVLQVGPGDPGPAEPGRRDRPVGPGQRGRQQPDAPGRRPRRRTGRPPPASAPRPRRPGRGAPAASPSTGSRNRPTASRCQGRGRPPRRPRRRAGRSPPRAGRAAPSPASCRSCAAPGPGPGRPR